MSIDSTVGRRMAKALEASPERKFVRALLPWIIAAAGLVTYVATLNRWMSLGSLPRVARLAGWSWQPDLYSPFDWLITLPLSWLPARLIPVGLNLFSAACAALTLALLARSVALLPHDRTHEQRQKEHNAFALLSIKTAWVPPLLAALVLGLQMTFWQDATTSSTGSCEMFNLLLFAYVIYSLLEFRLDQNESRLLRAALVYGAAMANNWAMIGFFPVFLVALIWIRGLAFFNLNFLVKMFLCGLAGLSLYLLLPLVQSMADIGRVPFWKALSTNLGGQKFILGRLLSKFYLFQNDPPLWIIAIPSLLPILVVSIKWPSYFGDTSKLGIAIATFIAHLVHAVLFVLCIWIALDPDVKISPRYNLPIFPFLTLYYLGALSVGYFAGYFLLLFGPVSDAPHRVPTYLRLLNWSLTGLIWAALVVSGVTLICKNLPQIRLANGEPLKQYASLLAAELPRKGAVVFSDNARDLFLAEAFTSQRANRKDFIFANTQLLQEPDYNRFLRKKYGQRWPLDFPKNSKLTITEGGVLQLLTALGQTNELYYLHPSFGYYFEILYAQPHGLVYKLDFYPSNILIAPLPSKSLVEENKAFWAKAETDIFPRLLGADETNLRPQTNLFQRWMHFAHLRKEPPLEALFLRATYSRNLNYWGVELQKLGELQDASASFQRAQQLNSGNSVAAINLECNQNFQAGRKAGYKSIEEIFGNFRSWDELMAENGPFDQPKVCFEQGRIYVRGGEYRQAANQFDRAQTLDPDNFSARLAIAQLYVVTKMPDQALKCLDELRAQPIPRTNQTEVLIVETSARLLSKDLNGAVAAVQAALDKYPADETLVAAASQTFIKYGYYTNALELIDKQLKLSPDNPNALLNKGYLSLHIEDYQNAIPPLTRVLTLETNVSSELHRTALLNRAIAFLRLDRTEESRRDYEALQKVTPADPRIFYGLAELAYRAKDTNSAVRNYQLYLSNTSTNTDEARQVASRIKELKGGSP